MSPLVGFWAITTRPDVGALAFELLGFLAFLRFNESRKRGTLLLVVIILYAAWSFKQTAVGVIAGVCLWLLANKRWRDAGIIVVTTFSLYAFTFVIGGTEYAYQVILSMRHQPFIPALGWSIFVRACTKAPLLPLTIRLFPYLLRTSNQLRHAGGRLVLWPFPIALAVSGLTAQKEGTSDNYFFLPAALSMLVVLQALQIQAVRRNKLVSVAIALCATAQILGIGLVLVGRAGRTSPEPEMVEKTQVLASSLPSLQAPVIVLDKTANLPWIQQRPPHFVWVLGTSSTTATARYSKTTAFAASSSKATLARSSSRKDAIRSSMEANYRAMKPFRRTSTSRTWWARPYPSERESWTDKPSSFSVASA